ncbi:hypothetical protein Tco_0401026 [Tanacetum coccineum]
MPPRMRTRSAGRPAAESLGGGTGERVGRGGRGRRPREGLDFKHMSAWLFLKDNHKWKNLDSTNTRINEGRVTEEEPELFVDDELPRPPGKQTIAKSQRSTNSNASSGSNPTMFQEMLQQQYTLYHEAKMERLDRETSTRVELINSQKVAENLKVLAINTSGMDPIDVAIINAQKEPIHALYQPHD